MKLHLHILAFQRNEKLIWLSLAFATKYSCTGFSWLLLHWNSNPWRISEEKPIARTTGGDSSNLWQVTTQHKPHQKNKPREDKPQETATEEQTKRRQTTRNRREQQARHASNVLPHCPMMTQINRIRSDQTQMTQINRIAKPDLFYNQLRLKPQWWC